MNVTAEAFEKYVERILAIDALLRAKAEDIAATYEEARWAGFDIRAIKSVIAARASGAVEGIPIEMLYSIACRNPDLSRREAVGKFDATPGFVYFAHFPGSRRLKIGFSTRVKRRLLELGTNACDTPRLLAVVAGTRKLEAHALTALGAFRMRGEWFSYTPQCAEALGKYLESIGALREVP